MERNERNQVRIWFDRKEVTIAKIISQSISRSIFVFEETSDLVSFQN